jgi:4-amino-4-deoxy-L-arabinose transferase-like glycosyltransferase
MSAPWIVGALSPVALALSWLIWNASDWESIPRVRHVVVCARRGFVVILVTCSTAAVPALLWIAGQRQHQIDDLIVKPVLERFQTTTTTAPPER